MKALYNKYKREIWVGVIVSLITTAILEFGDWFITIVPSVGISIFDTVSNIIYSLAATYTDNTLLQMLLLGSFGVFVGTFSKSMIDGIKLYSKVLRIEKKSKKLTPEELETLDTELSIELISNNKKIQNENFCNIIQEGKKIGKSAVLLMCIVIFTYLFFHCFVNTPMRMYNKFHQDIVKITPYVEQTTISQLESDWICMRSKSDFDEIYEVINQIIAENALPK